MRYLFFDTETTGVPQDYKAPSSDTDNWPRMVQLANMTRDWYLSYPNNKIIIFAPTNNEIEN